MRMSYNQIYLYTYIQAMCTCPVVLASLLPKTNQQGKNFKYGKEFRKIQVNISN